MGVGNSNGGWAKAPEDWTHSGTLARGPGLVSAGKVAGLRTAADLEIGDTAGLETCATGCTRGRVQLIHRYLSRSGLAVNKLGWAAKKTLILRGLFIHNPVNNFADAVNKLCISIRCRMHNKCYDAGSSLKERNRRW